MALDAPLNKQPDELDLRELCITLWQSKVLILGTTIVVTLITVLYVFLSTPIFEASTRLLPPQASDLTSYNAATQFTGDAVKSLMDKEPSDQKYHGIQGITPKDAYSAFLLRVNSDSVKQQFFNRYYLSAHNDVITEADKQALWNHLNRVLTVNLPKNANDVVTTVTLDGPNPRMIADWVNAYVTLAAKATQESFIQDLASEVKVRQKGIAEQIATLRKVAKIQLEERIARVAHALAVAKSIGLEAPPPGSPLIAIGGTNDTNNDINSFANGSTMYLQGAKALQSELTLLQKRIDNDAYIPELSNLLKKQSLLASIDLNPEHFAVVDIDRAATTPGIPSKPKKVLILALGLILGGILGIVAAIIRRMFRV